MRLALLEQAPEPRTTGRAHPWPRQSASRCIGQVSLLVHTRVYTARTLSCKQEEPCASCAQALPAHSWRLLCKRRSRSQNVAWAAPAPTARAPNTSRPTALQPSPGAFSSSLALLLRLHGQQGSPTDYAELKRLAHNWPPVFMTSIWVLMWALPLYPCSLAQLRRLTPGRWSC